MELHGNITENLSAAVASARRHKGHPVYKETIVFWSDLLQHARRLKAAGLVEPASVNDLLVELDLEVFERQADH